MKRNVATNLELGPVLIAGRRYALSVDESLEDVAGNNFRDLLDQINSTKAADVSSTALSINLTTCLE